MSDTRPPITAGPIERAFKFLKSASPTRIGEEEGLDVAKGDGASCADKIEIAKIETSKMQQRTIRVVMSAYHRVEPFQGKHVGYRGRRSASLTTPAVCDPLNRCNLLFTF
jgi:hypothetical protein